MSAHPLLPNLATGNYYGDLPTDELPIFGLTSGTTTSTSSGSPAGEKETYRARISYVYPHHRWFTDTEWGSLLVFSGLLTPSEGDGTLGALPLGQAVAFFKSYPLSRP